MLIKRKKHIVPELNTTATADISFMLLTFFLVTTSMDVDRGLVRQLPPLDDQQEQTLDATEVSRENTMSLKIDANGALSLNDKPVAAKGLRKTIAEFISHRPTQHVIYVDTDPAADYNAYFQLEDEIVAAYNSVRNNIAMRSFHKPYAALADAQKNKVMDMCPQHISETYKTSDANTTATNDNPAQQNNKEGGDK